jgi:hypothetical protein
MAKIVKFKRSIIDCLGADKWLKENVNGDYVMQSQLVTFLNDDDATAFIMKFGGIDITYEPTLFNMLNDSD